MWPFTKKQDLQDRLSKFVSADVAKDIISGTPSQEVEMRDCLILFILVQVNDSDLNEVGDLITSVSDILIQKRFTIVSVTSSLLLATYGFPLKELNPLKEGCEQVVKELTNDHPKKLKVLHGNVQGKYGLYGHPKGKTFGPILPKFDSILKQLVELSYGEYGECR
jgi:hypothetical protein